MTKLGSLISILAEMNAQLSFEHPIFIELQISRRVVNRITANDNQQLHAAIVEIVEQLLKRLPLIDRVRFDRISVENCLALIQQEQRVQQMTKCMNDWGLLLPANHQARSQVSYEIVYQCST